jgi:voltage-gated potassium channel
VVESKVAQQKNRPVRRDPHLPLQTILCKFLFSFGTLIDVASVLPYYIGLSSPKFAEGHTSSTASFIRIMRVFRIFRGAVLKDGDMPGILQRALSESSDAFILMGLLLVMATIIAGCIMYAAESGTFRITTDYPHGEYFRFNKLVGDYEATPSPFDSIPTSMYWGVATLTTVGYGTVVYVVIAPLRNQPLFM